MKRLLFTLLLLLPFSSVFSQTDIFVWEDGPTKFTSSFDTKSQSKDNLDRIYDYLIQRPANLFEAGNIWTINQMDSSFLAPLDSIYIHNKTVLNQIQLPEGAFWKELKAKRIVEMEQYYLAKRTEILSYTNPTVLLNKEYSNCLNYAQALNGTDQELLTIWKLLHEEQKKTNSTPEVLEARYLSELSSENSLLYAKFNVTQFGWWNCVNAQIHYLDEGHEQRIKEFKKLFIKTEAHFFED